MVESPSSRFFPLLGAADFLATGSLKCLANASALTSLAMASELVFHFQPRSSLINRGPGDTIIDEELLSLRQDVPWFGINRLVARVLFKQSSGTTDAIFWDNRCNPLGHGLSVGRFVGWAGRRAAGWAVGRAGLRADLRAGLWAGI